MDYTHSFSINEVFKFGLKNALDIVVYNGFKDFGNEPTFYFMMHKTMIRTISRC